MRFLTLLTLTLCCASFAQAEVYRWTDESGKVIYGDNPPEHVKASTVDLPMLTVADSFPNPANKAATHAATTTQPVASNVGSSSPYVSNATFAGYERFAIVNPVNGENIRSNTGSLDIELALQPALQEGHGIVLYVDGKQIGQTTASLIKLNDIERGEHTLFAIVHDADNKVLTNTETVKVNIQAATVFR